MKPLVSVIVPVYKVEDYLIRCLESLCRQSLQEIEIILVDDASPDRCGIICEEYAAQDFRFKVYHHTFNRGLSAARNTGIQNATADYLLFVDSDDWVSEDFCKLPYECALHNQADLVMFNYQRVKDDKMFFKGYSNVLSGHKSREEAINLLLNNTAAWNKLYRKELFNEVCFPEGYLFEDTGTTYKLFWNATNIYYIDKVLYFYQFRNASITQKRDSQTLGNWIEMNMRLYNGLLEKGFPKEKLQYFLEILSLLYCMKKKPDYSDKYYIFCEKVLLGSNNLQVAVTWKRKVLLALFKYCKPLFETICVLYGYKIVN